jgi:hypothetical protein
MSNGKDKEVKEIMEAMYVRPEPRTAMKCPVERDLAKIEKNVLFEARKMGANGFYSWSTKNRDGTKGRIEGPTIGLALMLYRNWTNADLTVRLVTESQGFYLIEAVFTDLETGTRFPALFKQERHSSGRGRMDNARKDDILFQIGQSKCTRNAILKGIPVWLIELAMAAAKGEDNKSIKRDNGDVIPKLLDSFKQLGVTKKDIEKKIDMPLEEATPAKISWLRGIYSAIKEEMTSVYDEFPRDRGAPTTTSQDQQVEDDDMRDFDLTLENVTNEK